MNTIVGKFVVDISDIITVKLPSSAQPLHFAEQHGVLCLWALIDLDQKEKRRFEFRMAGTGHPIEPTMSMRYMNTILMQGGSLVFHFFQL